MALTLLLLTSATSAESGQFYAISNSHAGPSKWDGDEEPTILYRVQDETLTKVRTISTGFDTTLFVRSYQDLGLVLVGVAGSSIRNIHLDVVDLSRMARQKSYDIDRSCGTCQINDGHLLKMGQRLIYMAEESDYLYWPPTYEGGSGHAGFSKVWYHGIDLGTGEPVRGLAGEDTAHAYSFGAVGKWSDRVGARFVNNEHIAVTTFSPVVYDPEQPTTRLRVTRKSDEASVEIEWQGYPVRPRGFRQWVVAEEVYEEGYYDLKPTGKMYFYNAETEQQTIHDTGEPDCVVLLVDEDNVAYYRVNDELLRADITDGKLANIKRIAKAPELLGVYWLVKGSW